MESFSFQFGRVEVRARLPAGDWLWPAVWLLPERNEYGDWPASGEIDIMESRGNRALNADGLGPSSVVSTLHWGPASNENAYKLTSKGKNSINEGIDYSKDFHTFGLYWTDKGLYTYIDDDSNRLLEVSFAEEDFFSRAQKAGMQFDYNPWNSGGSQTKAAPFDRKFYLILNVAVGGTSGFFPDSTPGKPWKDKSPQAAKEFWSAKSAWEPTWKGENGDKEANALVIDWIKVWSVDSSSKLSAEEQQIEQTQEPELAQEPNSQVNLTAALMIAISCAVAALAIAAAAVVKLRWLTQLVNQIRKTETETETDPKLVSLIQH